MTSQHGNPRMPQGKTGPASPKMTEQGNAELEEMTGDGEQDKLPLHEDIMQLARLGEIGPIQKLFEQGRYDAKYKDDENITPLHWAAINNHIALCKFLIDAGADVNAIGGESIATPAMWAAQRCHFYMVYLLLEEGADPLLTDGQGYNLLHLATFDGNVFLLLILLHQNIPIDGPDPAGHTSLMWAAYKGYPAVVELFLQWGASVNIRDENGFTALHWALVKGSAPCILKVVEAGSDRFAETNDGKTPSIVAQEMGTNTQWHRVLAELGLNSDATAKPFPLPYMSFIKNRPFLDRFFFLCPFVLLAVVLTVLVSMPIYAGVPFSVFLAYTLQWLAQQVLVWAPSNMKHLHRTPYLAGVFAASLFWVGVRWVSHVLPTTFSSHPVLNIVFAVFYSLCTYFYTISMIEDPGFVPKLGSRAQQKAVIDELISLWKFDEENFCVDCMIRMPVRSKHCKRCARCVAKHDHHCPWIHNCVGANNHRHFFCYVVSLEIGILAFVRIMLYYLDGLPPNLDAECNIISGEFCDYVLRDPFTVALSIWVVLQLIWVTMLLVVQSVQIARAQTTFESMRGNIHHASKASEAITSALTAGTSSMDGAQISGNGMGPNPVVAGDHHHHHHHHSPPPRRAEGFFGQWKKLLGLDTFIATASGSHHTRRHRNVFSRGVLTNCKDFWGDPAPYFGRRENGAGLLDGQVINYTQMYESPPRMKMRRVGGGGGDEGGTYQSVGTDESV